MNKSDSYFRQLDQAEARADEARLRHLRHRMEIKVEYIMRWYRDTDGDVIAPDNRMQVSAKYSQADLDFWLASFVQRGRDHTPKWVTVSKLLRLGANPKVRPMGLRGMPLPSAIETCQEMVEAYDPDHGRMLEGWHCSPARAREICTKTQAHFQGYLNQFAKRGAL